MTKFTKTFPKSYNNKVMIQSMEEQGWKLKSVEKGQPIMEMIIPKKFLKIIHFLLGSLGFFSYIYYVNK